MSIQRDQTLRSLPENASVCYLIGAGFSRASRLELPTAVGFLSREWRIPPCEGLTSGDTIRASAPHLMALDFIQSEYGPIETVNLETVLTDLHIRCTGIGRSWEQELGELQRVYESLIRYIESRLMVSKIDTTPCPLVSRFVTCIRSQDHILTLNYDVMLESHIINSCIRALKTLTSSIVTVTAPFCLGWGQGVPAVLEAHDARRRGFFAKLHGSIDWNTCPNRECPNYTSISITSPWARASKDPSGAQFRCGTCGSFPETVIIPPVAAKSFQRFPKLGIVWHRAANCLRCSHRLVLLGVSLAETDFHLESLLRRSLNQSMFAVESECSVPLQICIVNRGRQGVEAVRQRLKRILPPMIGRRIQAKSVELVFFDSVQDYVSACESVDATRKHSAVSTTTTLDY